MPFPIPALRPAAPGATARHAAVPPSRAGGRLLRRLLGIDPAEATFARRGFRGTPEARMRLERVGLAFLEGYHAALEARGGDALAERLGEVEAVMRGFACEGAAMALALLDALAPWR